MRRLSLILGLLLAIGAFVALFVWGQAVNPSPYRVVIAIQEVAAGERLTPDVVTVVAQSVPDKVAGEYVLEEELAGYLGKTIVDDLHPGQPLMHAHLVRGDNPAAVRRLALVMEDPNMAAMIVPVDAETAPQDIRPGDRVDVLYGVGNVSVQRAMPTPISPFPEETPTPGVLTPTYPYEEAGEGESATATPLPAIEFPMAKMVVRGLEVLDVIHEERPNPAYGGPDSGQPPTIEGNLLAIQVAVPREQEEILHLAITTGNYQVALLSPNAPKEDSPSLGMTWEDLEAFFWSEREKALSAITDTSALAGPGAASLLKRTPTPVGTLFPTPTPASSTSSTAATPIPPVGPSPTPAEGAPPPTPTPAAVAEGNEGGSVEGSEDAPAGDSDSGGTVAAGLVDASLVKGAVCGGVGLFVLALVGVAAARVLRRRDAGGS